MFNGDSRQIEEATTKGNYVWIVYRCVAFEGPPPIWVTLKRRRFGGPLNKDTPTRAAVLSNT